MEIQPTEHLCECGCRVATSPGKRFLPHHHLRKGALQLLNEERQQRRALQAKLEADIHDTKVREKAIKFGFCDITTAAVLPLSELESMIATLEKEDIGAHHQPSNDTPAQIIEELLEQVAVRSANQMVMDGCCKRCELMPQHLAKDCVCHRARKYLEETRI